MRLSATHPLCTMPTNILQAVLQIGHTLVTHRKHGWQQRRLAFIPITETKNTCMSGIVCGMAAAWSAREVTWDRPTEITMCLPPVPVPEFPVTTRPLSATFTEKGITHAHK